MLSFKNKIHNWIKDAELERGATMKQRASICSKSKVSRKSVSRKSSSSSSSKRSSKSGMTLKEKLKIAELLAEAEFIEKKQSAKVNEMKQKLERRLAKSKAKVKTLEDLRSIDFIMTMYAAHNNLMNSMTSITSQPRTMIKY